MNDMDLKRWRLRRMRTLAAALLLLMLVLLFASSALVPKFAWLHWVRAFAEAAAVGAMADWYAVVALFRRPLKLPIPHTAIIPRNKDRIAESLGAFVEQNFLTPDNVLRRMRNHNAAEAIARWLGREPNRVAVAQAMGDLVPVVLRAGSDADLQRLLDRSLHPMLLKLNIARAAGHLLEQLMEDERHHALLDKALAALEAWLRENQPMILAKFSEASRYTPPILDDYIVGRFVTGIVALLHEVAADPRHELRLRFEAGSRQLVEDLKTSGVHRRVGRKWMRDVLAHLREQGYAAAIWNDMRHRLETDLRAGNSVLREQIAAALERLGSEVLADPALQRKLNGWWLEIVRDLVLQFRHEASALISEVVRSWDADEISRKLELEIGTDLQFIRINGTVVGGAVGVALHAATLAIG
jgi:uncharacterized membrane-anchored protein YjiN (DUF445 family)